MLRNKISKILIGVTLLAGLATASPISAGNDLCSVFGPLCDPISGGGAPSEEETLDYVLNRTNIIIGLVFVVIILIAVYIIIKSAVRYIRSGGQEGEMEAAQGAIKNVFIGIALLFVGIVGIVLLLSFFGGTGLFGLEETPQDIFLRSN